MPPLGCPRISDFARALLEQNVCSCGRFRTLRNRNGDRHPQPAIRFRLWGASHIRGELLRLGFVVAQSTIAKYMAKKGDPSGQSWGTFLHNHAPHIVAMDLFVVPTIGFISLYVLVIVRLARRELVWINATAHPTGRMDRAATY